MLNYSFFTPTSFRVRYVCCSIFIALHYTTLYFILFCCIYWLKIRKYTPGIGGNIKKKNGKIEAGSISYIDAKYPGNPFVMQNVDNLWDLGIQMDLITAGKTVSISILWQ